MSATRAIGLLFALSALASLALVVVYLLGGQPQVEGTLLAASLGALGTGIVMWAVRLLDAPEISERRHTLTSPPETREEVIGTADLARIGRRTFLVRMLLGAGGALVAALAVPVLSLGPQPGRVLFQTPWRAGLRVVNDDGTPLRPDELGFDTVRTVFPEGAIGSHDAATILVRVRPSELQLDGPATRWTPAGCVGYSKICTHAGCPVGLYRAEDHALLCPCHQSTFDVLRGAVPTFGPAARPLPQLPLGVDDEGFLVALGDFPEPIGPSFWNLTHNRDGAEIVDDGDPAEQSE